LFHASTATGSSIGSSISSATGGLSDFSFDYSGCTTGPNIALETSAFFASIPVIILFAKIECIVSLTRAPSFDFAYVITSDDVGSLIA